MCILMPLATPEQRDKIHIMTRVGRNLWCYRGGHSETGRSFASAHAHVSLSLCVFVWRCEQFVGGSVHPASAITFTKLKHIFHWCAFVFNDYLKGIHSKYTAAILWCRSISKRNIKSGIIISIIWESKTQPHSNIDSVLFFFSILCSIVCHNRKHSYGSHNRSCGILGISSSNNINIIRIQWSSPQITHKHNDNKNIHMKIGWFRNRLRITPGAR